MVKTSNMEKNKILDIANDVENKSNKDLLNVLGELHTEYEKTKDLIISLTRHLDSVEILYNKVNEEIGKRNIK
jgi:hypothetical protein